MGYVGVGDWTSEVVAEDRPRRDITLIACMRMAVLYGCCCLLDLHELSTPLFVKKPHSNFFCACDPTQKFFAPAARKKSKKIRRPSAGTPIPFPSCMHGRDPPSGTRAHALVLHLLHVHEKLHCGAGWLGAHVRMRDGVFGMPLLVTVTESARSTLQCH